MVIINNIDISILKIVLCPQLSLDKFFYPQLGKCSATTAGGTAGDGDGTGKGNCADDKHFCYKDADCSLFCSKSDNSVTRVTGDGKTRGNCPNANDFCYKDGKCDGIQNYKHITKILVFDISTILGIDYPWYIFRML